MSARAVFREFPPPPEPGQRWWDHVLCLEWVDVDARVLRGVVVLPDVSLRPRVCRVPVEVRLVSGSLFGPGVFELSRGSRTLLVSYGPGGVVIHAHDVAGGVVDGDVYVQSLRAAGADEVVVAHARWVCTAAGATPAKASPRT